jgi:hypothetical protein
MLLKFIRKCEPTSRRRSNAGVRERNVSITNRKWFWKAHLSDAFAKNGTALTPTCETDLTKGAECRVTTNHVDKVRRAVDD